MQLLISTKLVILGIVKICGLGITLFDLKSSSPPVYNVTIAVLLKINTLHKVLKCTLFKVAVCKT